MDGHERRFTIFPHGKTTSPTCDLCPLNGCSTETGQPVTNCQQKITTSLFIKNILLILVFMHSDSTDQEHNSIGECNTILSAYILYIIHCTLYIAHYTVYRHLE